MHFFINRAFQDLLDNPNMEHQGNDNGQIRPAQHDNGPNGPAQNDNGQDGPAKNAAETDSGWTRKRLVKLPTGSWIRIGRLRRINYVH